MKKEILKKALEKVHYVGEVFLIIDMTIHIGQFAKEHVLPLLKKNKNEVPMNEI